MLIKLNAEAVQQLESIMKRKSYSSHVHTIQLMLSQITKNFARADNKNTEAEVVSNI